MQDPDSSSWKTWNVPAVWVILGMVILAIPFAAGLLSAKACACIPLPADTALAVRTGPDTISIVMHPDPSKHHDAIPVLVIFANDLEVTNQSAIDASHLPLSITPPEGLAFREGSTVTLQGDWVAGNESVPAHIQIIAIYPDTYEQWVIGEQIF